MLRSSKPNPHAIGEAELDLLMMIRRVLLSAAECIKTYVEKKRAEIERFKLES